MKHKWMYTITIVTFFLSIIISVLSEISLRNLNIILSFVTLLAIIFIGIFFDVIGTAITAADAKPFNAMASKKIKGSGKAVLILKNASVVSNFCNDVVGDISGIISGATVTLLVYKLSRYDIHILNISIFSVFITSFTASLTVGGKAFGKHVAINHWKGIVHRFAVIIEYLEEKLNIIIVK